MTWAQTIRLIGQSSYAPPPPGVHELFDTDQTPRLTTTSGHAWERATGSLASFADYGSPYTVGSPYGACTVNVGSDSQKVRIKLGTELGEPAIPSHSAYFALRADGGNAVAGSLIVLVRNDILAVYPITAPGWGNNTSGPSAGPGSIPPLNVTLAEGDMVDVEVVGTELKLYLNETLTYTLTGLPASNSKTSCGVFMYPHQEGFYIYDEIHAWAV